MVSEPTHKFLSSLSAQSQGIWFVRIWQFWSERHLEGRRRWSIRCVVLLAAKMEITVRNFVDEWWDQAKGHWSSINSHQIIHQFWESLTSATTSSRLGRDSSCQRSLRECFDLRGPPFAGSVGGKSVDKPKTELASVFRRHHRYRELSPFLDQTDPEASNRFRFLWAS